MEGRRRRHRVLLDEHRRRQAVHRRQPRRHRVHPRVRPGDGQEAVGSGQRLRVQQRSGRRPAWHTDSGRRSVVRDRRRRRPFMPRNGNRRAPGLVGQLSQDIGRIGVPIWGYSESPRLVWAIACSSTQAGRTPRLWRSARRTDRSSGRRESDPAGYPSAIAHQVGGVQQAVFFTARRAVGVDVGDGHLLWEYERVANRVANIATPIAGGESMFLSSDYGTGGRARAARRRRWRDRKEVYFSQEMRNHHSSSMLVGEASLRFLECDSHGASFCRWRCGVAKPGRRQGLNRFADGRLYLFSENGVAGLAEASPAGYVERGRFNVEQAGLPTLGARGCASRGDACISGTRTRSTRITWKNNQ